MTTIYSLSDSLPKDAGGAKFAAFVDVATSQLDFALPAGIGSRTVGSKIVSALQVGTHVAGSKIEPTGGVGVALMAHWASATSSTAVQNAVHLRGTDRGELHVTQLAATTCAMSGSRETVTTNSGILYRAIVSGCGLAAGACVTLFNGGTSLAQVMFESAWQNHNIDFGPGACFGSLTWERRNSVGTASVVSIYKTYGQL